MMQGEIMSKLIHDSIEAVQGVAGLVLLAAVLNGCATHQIVASPVDVAQPSGEMPVTEAGAAPAGATASASPLDTDWVFVEIDGYDGELPGPSPVPGFIMTRQGGRMAGSTACNQMAAEYELDTATGSLRFSKLRNTRRMCARAASDTEQAVLDAMISTDAFRVVDGDLELLSKGGVVARLRQPQR